MTENNYYNTKYGCDVSFYYNDIMKDLRNNRINNKWLCNNNEESYSDYLYEIINKSINNILCFRREVLVTHLVILHELKNCEDNKDRIILEYMYHSLKLLRNTDLKIYDVLRSMSKKVKEYNIRKNSDIAKAILYDAKKIKERIERNRQMITNGYIFTSAVRPYYFYLQKQGIKFIDDINTHIKLDGKWEEEKDKFDSYIDIIIKYSKESNNVSYKDARMEEYFRICIHKEKTEMHKQIERQEKTLCRQRTKLNKFVLKKEKSYRNQPWRIIDTITNNSKYDIRYTSCSAIVALCRIDNEEVFKYFTPHGLVSNIEYASLYFDNEIQDIEKYKEICESYDDVVCVSTVRLI